MKKLIELRQKKAELIANSRSILNAAETEKRALSDEDNTKLKSINTDIEAINQQITHEESVSDHERSLVSGDQAAPDNTPSNEELRSFVQTGDARSLSAGVQADGGYTVIPTVDNQIHVLLKERSVFRQNATIKSHGSEVFKKLVSVGGTSVDWAAETDTRNETNTSKLEELEIKLNSLYAYPKTTQEILDWSSFNVADWLASEVAAETVLKEEAAFWNGDAVKKPKGILTYTRSTDNDAARTFGEIQEALSATTGVIDFDDLITFLHAFAVPYRNNLKWYMSDSMALSLRKLKNNDGDYIWRDSVQEGQATTLLGKPVIISDQIADDEVVLADLSMAYYVIDHSTGTRMIRDNITQPGYVKMLTTRYVGGGLVDSNAVKILKKAA
ncbi:phage major capsid protein [Glaciecola petra]|uniref:Phage major capsid protein n=1 Tax=Glaciecola petra TaxID=3075602 RepID=A0ABU2ZPK7_9ALTE|nr:phage major capsid protein [Aestuariibacter sp. P117]MDT0594553.1 phage major capsid protein [Aestuariibacter sp. P117]